MKRPSVRDQGFAIADHVLSFERVSELRAVLTAIDDTASVRKRGETFAIRNLFDVSPEFSRLANADAVRALVEPVLGSHCFPVRALFFDKSPSANWTVPWHQDVTIAVSRYAETAGFGPWTLKARVLHVQPPSAILEQMLSVRLHLDDCGVENGALRVVPGSHRLGRIPAEKIAAVRESMGEAICSVGIGAAVLMRPLVIHASSRSRIARHRRVVHFDFASTTLPEGLRWLAPDR